MFETGNLLFFNPFIFKNGAKPQNKFMLVLGEDTNGNAVLASLPTSKDHVPGDVVLKSGCIEMPERQVNVFVFMADECVVESDGTGQAAFAFDVNTFVYGMDLDTYPIIAFQQQLSDGETKVKLIGKLSDAHFDALRECLQNSKMVKNKYKRLIAGNRPIS